MEKTVRSFCMILFIGTMLIFCRFSSAQIIDNYWENKKKAFTVETPAESRSSLQFCSKLLKVNPNHPVMNYLAARLNEQLGKRDAALKFLKKAVQLGYTSNIRWLKIHPLNDPAFNSLRNTDAFKEIIECMNSSDKPISKSKTAFVLNDKSIRTEGMTYDPEKNKFYFGSGPGIVEADHLGNCTDFIKEAGQDGLGWVNGIHVDPVRRILWACSNGENRAEVCKYSLSSGKLIKKYAAPSDDSRHFFNDLVLHPNGDVYVTDIGCIRLISHLSGKLELFYKGGLFTGSNGITLSDNGQVIFAADDVHGICRIDIKTKKLTALTHEGNFHTYGIDGLYYQKGSLYAIQNELLPQVCRFILSRDAERIKNCEYLEKNTDNLHAPTTGVFVEDNFYFIADSQGKGSRKKGVIVMKTHVYKKNAGE